MGWGRERWKGAGTERGVGLGGGKREGVGIECFFFVVWMCLCVFFFLRVGREGMGWNGMEWNGYPVLECGWVEGGVCISLAFHLLSIFF